MNNSAAAGRGAPMKDPLERSREYLMEVEAQLRRSEAGPGIAAGPLDGLLQVVELINADLDVEMVLHTAAQQIIDVFECERVFVAKTSAREGVSFLLAVDYEGRPIPHPETEVSHAVIREVSGAGRPALVTDASADPRFADVSSVKHLHLHSVMAAPLLARGTLHGVIYADNRSLPGAFTEDSLRHLSLLANHIAIALRNAHLFQQLDATRNELAQAERLRMLGQVAAYVAHEVKNPLSSIQILVDSLADRWNDATYRESVVAIVPKEVRRLSAAVKRILEYARPTPLIKTPVQLGPLIDSAIHILAPEARREDIEVTQEVAPSLPPVLADGERLREVFVNLLRNAIQALAGKEKRAVRVTVRLTDDGAVECLIEDTGPGIPGEAIETIFEPFRTSKADGSGLGLAFSQKIVREHGGQITARNILESGAQFRIALPVQGE